MFDFRNRTGDVLKYGLARGHIGDVGNEAKDKMEKIGRKLGEQINVP